MMWWWIDVGDGTGRSRRQARKRKKYSHGISCAVWVVQGEWRGMSQKEEKKKKHNRPDQTRPDTNCGTVT